MKKRTISKLKSIFGSKKSKRHHQESSKSSRSPSPEPASESHNGHEFQPIRTPPPSRVGPPPSPPVPTNPIAPVPPDPAGPMLLSPCPVCCRTFLPQSLDKHIKICQKMTVKKRKMFDSSRQRREGTEMEQYLPKNFGLPENSPFLEKSPPHTAKPVVKPKPSVKAVIAKPSAELQRCPHCTRTFGVRAFERHVEWCADKAKILPAAPTQPQRVSDAKQRLEARTQYKAPPVRSRRTSTSRDKSSNSRSASVESTRGVSPPREYGDYRNPRRASESVSSNDDPAPHVPVIRNTRNSLNSLCGDAVKARQARLARDLSSTSKQEPTPPSIQKTNSEINARKVALAKFREQSDIRKKEQLKKLEEIARKYDERQQMIKEEKQQRIKAAKERSRIPKKNSVRKQKRDGVDLSSDDGKVESTLHSSSKTITDKAKSAATKTQPLEQVKVIETNVSKTKTRVTRKEFVELNKESTMSLDSLEEIPNPVCKKAQQSIGINTELLCPCVPCIIHADHNADPKLVGRRKSVSEKCDKSEKNYNETTDFNSSEPKIEFLYKNLTMVSSCDIQSRNENETFSKEDLSIPHYSKSTKSINNIISAESSLNFLSKTKIDHNDSGINTDTITIDPEQRNASVVEDKGAARPTCSIDKADDLNNLSAEIFEEDYEHDMSNAFDDSIDNERKEDIDDCKENTEILCRHGSGDTYTKFTENPADLEEFMTLTDKMIGSDSNEQTNDIDRDTDVDNFYTPKTSSLEAIVENSAEKNTEHAPPEKPEFSATFEELKSYFKALVDGSGSNIEKVIEKSEGEAELAQKKVSDLEHITIYEKNKQYPKNIKNSRQEKNTPKVKQEGVVELKLPSISEHNKVEGKTYKKKMQAMYKSNKKCKMLAEQDRGKKEYKTYIKEDQGDSDGKSMSTEEPPLKLPRIEKKRIDDTYDPFASAARQMKELMSSETNIPKKLQNCSNSTRTLPMLRPSREKSISSLRADNTKMMKDSLNKTYQKTPTLQRMKSFGSTTNDNTYTFGSRCSSFRNNKKSSQQKLNTTFTKCSKENISTTTKSYFNRNSNLNRSFSSYTASAYSTPKPKEKNPKISPSMHHSFQRTTLKQPAKLGKISTPKIEERKKGLVNLDSILAGDNSSMTDSNYIDPRLINENDNLPINVNTILNNPDIISSMESLLTTENLPAKFDSFNVNNVQDNNNDTKQTKNNDNKINRIETNNNMNKKHVGPILDDLSAHYEKIMSSLEQTKNIASKTSIRDDDSICEDFDLEEFIICFDDELHKQQVENKRTCSSTTRVVRQAELADSNKTSQLNSVCSSPTVAYNDSNGLLPINKSMSFNFSSNNVVGDNLFPSSVKRSTSLLESIQKKNVPKTESAKSRLRADQLEQDIMQSLKDFDKFYEPEKMERETPVKETTAVYTAVQNGTARRDSRVKPEKKPVKHDNATNGNYTPNGKSSDSAYSSLNRISPSKLSVCNSKDSNGQSLDQIPAGSDSSGCQKDEIRSLSSDEFLAMERSAELDEPITQPTITNFKEMANSQSHEKHSSRASSRRSNSNQWPQVLSSSGSEVSLHRPRRDSVPAPRLSRFCHECGSKFPVDTAKFCIECGVKRLAM